MDLAHPLLARIGIISGVTAIGAVWLNVQGPLPLIRFTTVMPEPVPWWYSISAFPVLGALAADLWTLARSSRSALPPLELAVQMFVVCLLGNLRLGVRIPVSGHVLLFSYFLMRRLLLTVQNDPIKRIEWLGAAASLLVAACVKVVWWRDPLTLVFGLVVGIGLACLSRWLMGRHLARTVPSRSPSS